MKTLHLIVTGRVQGVWFRQHTMEQALALGITGWVRNVADGSVEIMATGNDKQLESFLVYCHKGPPKAMVSKVTLTEMSLEQFPSFIISR